MRQWAILVIIFLNFGVLLNKTRDLSRLRDANSISLICLPTGEKKKQTRDFTQRQVFQVLPEILGDLAMRVHQSYILTTSWS